MLKNRNLLLKVFIFKKDELCYMNEISFAHLGRSGYRVNDLIIQAGPSTGTDANNSLIQVEVN